VVDELFNIKILDPAMGSGHFLVEAVDYITDKTLDFLNAFPWNPVIAQLFRMRETILQEMDDQGITIDPKRLTDVNLLKRHVLKRCIYGVDINPMAVELAKVSLWLDCFTLGAPLSFLDHHFRCGNSLIGVTVEEVDKIRAATEQLTLSASSDWQGLLQAIQGMIEVGGLPDVTSAQVARSRTAYKSALSNLENFKKILDIHTARWFVSLQTDKDRRKKTKLKVDPFDLVLNSADLFDWSHGKKSPLLDREPHRSLLSDCARAAKEKRFFHWELEFPEVFYGPRPGTTQAIERLDGGGFDAVIGNPPYDVLSVDELGDEVSRDLAFYDASNLYRPAMRGARNLYKLFICRGADALTKKGALSFITPMSLLGDDQAVDIRKLLLKKTTLSAIEAFPQKDNQKNRVFPEAKLSTAIFTARAVLAETPFVVRTHGGRYLDDSEAVRLLVRTKDLEKLDPDNLAIPCCTDHDWKILQQIWNGETTHLGQVVSLSEGEIHPAVHRECLSFDEVGPLVLRGAGICLYALREASQGEPLHLNVRKYLQGKGKDSKAYDHRFRRIGFQRKAPQNNFRRIIAAPIPEGNFCFESIKYITTRATQLDLDFLAALLNSQLIDWYFRTTSTNAQINEYQFNVLPCVCILNTSSGSEWKALAKPGQWQTLAEFLASQCTRPGTMPKAVADALAEMSRSIQEIESKRVLKNRFERSQLAAESQPIQDAIDAVLFRCYGLSENEAKYIEKRLEEML